MVLNTYFVTQTDAQNAVPHNISYLILVSLPLKYHAKIIVCVGNIVTNNFCSQQKTNGRTTRKCFYSFKRRQIS